MHSAKALLLLPAFFFLELLAAASPLQIPFRFTPGQIEIQVSIQDRPPIWCILDSGAEFSMLDREVAKSLKLGPVQRESTHERIENLKIRSGPLTLEKQTFTLWNLNNFRRQKREIRGVIGCELFERYAVTIDFQKQLIILNEPSSFHPNPNSRSLPITFDGRLPVLQANLTFREKKVPAKLMVDTGASQAVILRYPFATKHGMIRTDNSSKNSETVASGTRAFIGISIRELALDRWKFQNPDAEAYGTPSGAGGYTSTDGLLGNDILQHFRVTFDYSRKRLILEERKKP